MVSVLSSLHQHIMTFILKPLVPFRTKSSGGFRASRYHSMSSGSPISISFSAPPSRPNMVTPRFWLCPLFFLQCLSLRLSETNTSPDAVKPLQTAAAASFSDLERRWPGGTKVTRYRKAELEKFAPYLRSDGLVTRLTTYKDLDCKC